MRIAKENINKEEYIKFAVEVKKNAFDKYKEIQLYCLNNTSISPEGNIIYDYDAEETNKKLASAERNFINASNYLVDLLEILDEKEDEDSK